MATKNSSETVEALASEIGDNVYIDIAKWHLYLRDAHLHTIVAEKLYPLVTKQSANESNVLEALKSISVKLGGGKREIPLLDLIPSDGQVNLMDILEEFQRDL